MAEVDNKVVSITFDNAMFERKMTETIASLDKLRRSLDMSGAQKGLADLSKAGSHLNVDGAAASVEGLSGKMIALSTIGITALATLTSKILEVGGHLASSFSLAPVTAGFGEFELKMGSIQTIMAGSGESLATVNQKLADLNAYSDKTIYSFKDMTSNIGKFTNAGVSLDKSVAAIQGVANVAALSGANAEEASRGMYNFAQALSAGHVKLMDWKSIELANMATVEFKQELIDSAVAMGTLTKSGDGWKTKAGSLVTPTKGFNESLTDQWLTAEALTSTLGKYSDAQTDIGARATAAATDVKTFSQMIDTMKESLASGWSTTFENIFGNFEEGKELWTGINNAFGGLVGKSAESRNEMLAQWKAFQGGGGGRTALLGGLKDAMKGIGTIIKPISEAFREIFPRKTAKDLLVWTASFVRFAKTIKIGADTAEKLKAGFKTFFAILDIGWEIIKGVTSVFFTLVKGVMKLLGPILGLVAGNSKFVHSLHEMLVQEGGIKKFFDTLNSFILKPFEAITKLTGAVISFFGSLSLRKSGKKGAEEATEGLEKTASIAEKLLNALKNVFGQIGEFLSDVGGTIGDAFKGLGGAISKAIGTGDFNQVMDVLKVGLLGGILNMLRKFFKHGIKFDFGQSKLFDKIGNMFDAVTGSLKSLQTAIRAKTLMTIAIALGILTLSIIALSLVDGKALAKSMAAITAGFAELTAVMFALEKMSQGGGALKIAAMAGGMVLMAAAMALLVIPIKALSKMDMADLAKGLGGVIVGMLAMAAAVRVMGSDNKGIFRAAAAMILISVALIVLAKAIKSFAEMNLTEMAWGLAQAALGIALLIQALKHMPDDIAKKGLGLLILAFSLRSLAKVVQLFADISFGTLAKGFFSIAGGLFLMGKAMDQFPEDMIQKSVGLVIMSGAMFIMGKAIEQVGKLPLGDLIKGVGALAVMLGVLAVAIVVMDEAKGGIAALILGAAGLLIMGRAIEEVGSLPFDVLIKGIVGLAAVLGVLAIASLVAPGILLLGIALAAVGLGMVLFGGGIALAGIGFKYFAQYGTQGLAIVIDAMQAFIQEIPGFVSAFVVGIMQAAIEIGKQFPQLVGTISEILRSVLVAIQDIIPEIGKTISGLLDEGLRVFTDAIPDFVDAGYALLLGLLRGLEKNISDITHTVGGIITGFLDAFAEEVPDIIESLTNLMIQVFESVAFNIGRAVPELLIGVGANFLNGFITGIMNGVSGLFQTITGIITDVIDWFLSGFGIFSPSKVMMDIGINIIKGLLKGIVAFAGFVKTWFIEFPIKAVKWLGNVVKTLFNKGKDLIVGLFNGIKDKIVAVKDWYLGLGPKIRGWLGDMLGTLFNKGKDLIKGLWNGLVEKIDIVQAWVGNLPGKIIRWLGNTVSLLVDAGKDLIRGLWGGINKMKDWVMDKVKGFAGSVVDGIKGFFGIGSPSKVFMGIGVHLGEGLGLGLGKMGRYVALAAIDLANNVQRGWEKANTQLMASLGEIDQFSPTIAPVLDLSQVRAEAKKIDSLIDPAAISPTLSIDRANVIAASSTNQNGSDVQAVPTGPTEVKYEQNIYAPVPLSTADVYRQTKSLIALTKEDLDVA